MKKTMTLNLSTEEMALLEQLVRKDQIILAPAELDLILELRRHIAEEGWTAEHDDQHAGGEMAVAAAAYAAEAAAPEDDRDPANPPDYWPWDPSWWKSTTRRRDLEKAASLCVAEMKRLDRAAARAAG